MKEQRGLFGHRAHDASQGKHRVAAGNAATVRENIREYSQK